jgi:ubiquinone/menaquinone biosynthesis C-methylase UbiE
LRDIDDKKAFLHQLHQDKAEGYNKMMANREFSNKLPRYRKVILSYAQGDILECGVATGHTFQHYQKENVKSYIGIDWSSNMLLQAFEKLEELGPKSFSHGEDKKFFKLM